MAHGADMARETRVDATRHARPCGRAARAHSECRWRIGGADAWQGPLESMRTREGVPPGEREMTFGGPWVSGL